MAQCDHDSQGLQSAALLGTVRPIRSFGSDPDRRNVACTRKPHFLSPALAVSTVQIFLSLSQVQTSVHQHQGRCGSIKCAGRCAQPSHSIAGTETLAISVQQCHLVSYFNGAGITSTLRILDATARSVRSRLYHLQLVLHISRQHRWNESARESRLSYDLCSY